MSYHIKIEKVDNKGEANAQSSDGTEFYFVQVYTQDWFDRREWVTDAKLGTEEAEDLSALSELKKSDDVNSAFVPCICGK